MHYSGLWAAVLGVGSSHVAQFRGAEDEVASLQRELSVFSTAYERRTGVRPRTREHWGEEMWPTYERLGAAVRARGAKNSSSRARRLEDDGLTAGVAADGTDTTNTGELSETGCYAPVGEGSWGFCGPLSCNAIYLTCIEEEGGGPATVNGVTGTYGFDEMNGVSYTADTCVPYYDTSDEEYDLPDYIPNGNCDATCTQETAGVCSSTFLANVIKGTGVKSAYCNDKWLVIMSDGSNGGLYEYNLNDISFPPGAVVDGVAVRTGMLSLNLRATSLTYYPLSVTLLDTADLTNNEATMDGERILPGIPVPGEGVGVSVSGMQFFPVYNNVAEWTPEKCEVDSCSEHVGQGGGQPHYHGDPFGDQDTTTSEPSYCLYGPSNYSSGIAGHPPVVGFGYDGHLIYGRYLDATAPGFQAPLLDACGGHVHDDTTEDEHGFDLSTMYHYHTQVFDGECSADTCETGDAFKITTTGPFQCLKADLSAYPYGSSALLLGSTAVGSTFKSSGEMNYRCCDMTDYYVINGLADNYGDTSDSFAASSTCVVPANPSNGAYESSGSCTVGATLYSGNTCASSSITCDSGYEVSGTTRCVGGEITETAFCAASVREPTAGPTSKPTAGPTSKPTGPTSKPTAHPAPSPTAASSVSSGITYTTVGTITLAGLSYANALAEEAVLITAVADAAGVQESIVSLAIVAARRRRRLLDDSDSVEITYTITSSSSTVASSAFASMQGLEAFRFDNHLQAAAESASVTAIFADVSTSALSEPTRTEDSYDVDAAVSKRPASLLAALALLAACFF